MKCPHCKEELSQDDYNICPFCAKPIKTKKVCPHCNEELNQDDYKICPFCAELLEAAAPSAPPSEEWQKPPSRAPRTIPPQPTPVEVVVKVQEEKKRRLDMLWVLILLLLLLVCCCGLMLTEQVEVPEIIAPQVNPILDNMRESLPDFIGGLRTDGGDGGDGGDKDGGGNGKQPAKEEEADCDDEELRQQIMRDVDLEFKGCFGGILRDGMCEVHLENTENMGNLELIIWSCYEHVADCLDPRIVECEDHDVFQNCTFPEPRWPEDDGILTEIDFEVIPKGCNLDDGLYVRPGPWDRFGNKIGEVAEEEVDECCELVDISHVGYIGTPGVSRDLSFDLELGCMPFSDDDPELRITGSAYIGADPQDIFWTDVECYYPSDISNVYHCHSTVGNVDQKESTVRVELEYEGCEWEVFFHTPPYFRGVTGEEDGGECQSGQVMCAGSCCSNGHCSQDSDGTWGCF